MQEYRMKYQKALRCGITTGTCAAAAATAAARNLLLGIKESSVLLMTPKGVRVEVPVRQTQIGEKSCEYCVIKDSGDDPDVTNGTQVLARVEIMQEEAPDTVFTSGKYPGLYLDGGIGIGRVTKAGLEQAIGQAAINAVPRDMIFQAVDEVRRLAGFEEKLRIVVSMPEGETLSLRTFNPRLGIEGGLSVLGTSGIVEPMSEKAIVDTIETQIRQLAAQGITKLLVTPGNYGQGYVSDYMKLDLTQSIKCSNYIGETLDLAVSYGMKDFLLVGNIGKLVKLAAGIMNTHSKVADGRCEIFTAYAALCGADTDRLEQIMESITTEEILVYLQEWGIRDEVMQRICHAVEKHVAHRVGGKLRFGVMIFSEKQGFLGETKDAQEVLRAFLEERK